MTCFPIIDLIINDLNIHGDAVQKDDKVKYLDYLVSGLLYIHAS